MKIYYSVYDLSKEVNPYTRTLAEGIQKLDKNTAFVWGHKYFWTDEIFSCNIVHIHWPEQLLNGGHTSDDLEKRLAHIKAKGGKVVATCHNFSPHLMRAPERVKAYQATYAQADAIIHLGEYSCNVLKEQLPTTRHVVIPHHVYDRIYTSMPSREEAVRRLKVDGSKRYVLCFGAFRNDEERNLAIDVAKKLRANGVSVAAPGFAVINRRNNPKVKIPSVWQYIKYSLLYPNILKCRNKVADKDVPYFYALADVCMIPRLEILNSGNVPMALLMGKCVVGPDVGNVGELLRTTGNPTFAPHEINSVVPAVRKALDMADSKGKENRNWALKNLNTDLICQKTFALYQSILL